MKKLTKQQMFNKAVLGVVRQGRLSKSKDSQSCFYRSKAGGVTLACGVGQLIEDDLYRRSCEGAPADNIHPDRTRNMRDEVLMLSLLFSGVDVTDLSTVRLLEEIQAAHDCAENVEEFVQSCDGFAKAHSVTMPRLPKQFA